MYTNSAWVWHGFTKLAVSRLIMVWFENFKILHAQDFDADRYDVTMTSRATRCAWWRDVIDLVTVIEASNNICGNNCWKWAMGLALEWHCRFCSFLVDRLLWPNELRLQKFITNGQILEVQEAFVEYHDNRLVSMETNSVSSLQHPPSTFPPSLVLVGP